MYASKRFSFRYDYVDRKNIMSALSFLHSLVKCRKHLWGMNESVLVIHGSPPMYKARNQVAALDFHLHADREVKRNSEGDTV